MKVDKDFWNIKCKRCGKDFDGRSKVAISFFVAYAAYSHLCPKCSRLFRRWLKQI